MLFFICIYQSINKKNNMEQNIGNAFDHRDTLHFFRRWWRLLAIVFVVAAIVSAAVAWLIKP